MISDLVAVGEIFVVAAFTIYAVMDNERVLPSLLGSLFGIVLSGVVGYQFLFGLITSSEGTVKDPGVGYFFFFIAIVMTLVNLVVIIDSRMKGRE